MQSDEIYEGRFMELSWQRTQHEEMWNFSTCGRVVGCRELILSPTRPLPLPVTHSSKGSARYDHCVSDQRDGSVRGDDDLVPPRAKL